MIKDLDDFYATLYGWYATNGRKTLPWRVTRDPYAIWVSEVMLQQTQVKTVLERYYGPFLARFPTIQALAQANLQEVLKSWEGLGYYTRARNLHKAAQTVVFEEKYGFLFNATSCHPELVSGSIVQKNSVLADEPWMLKQVQHDKEVGFGGEAIVKNLMLLPGIGQNTAHAIAAFAYHTPVPVLEANVKRVMARVFALKRSNEADLWQKAEQLLDTNDPFTYNQAMMDIGALVCTKTAPKCDICPLLGICEGKESPESYPEKRHKKAVPVRKKTIVLYQDGQQRYLVAPRTTQFLHGLYGFAEYDRGNIPTKTLTRLGTIRHSYSHFTLDAEVYMGPIPPMSSPESPQAIIGGSRATRPGLPYNLPRANSGNDNDIMNGEWKNLNEIKQLPLSRADSKVLDLLEKAA